MPKYPACAAVGAAVVVEIAGSPPHIASTALTYLYNSFRELFYLHGELVELCTITSARPLIPKGYPDTKERVQLSPSTMYSRKERHFWFKCPTLEPKYH